MDGISNVYKKRDAGSFWKSGYSQEQWYSIDQKYFDIYKVATSSKK